MSIDSRSVSLDAANLCVLTVFLSYNTKMEKLLVKRREENIIAIRNKWENSYHLLFFFNFALPNRFVSYKFLLQFIPDCLVYFNDKTLIYTVSFSLLLLFYFLRCYSLAVYVYASVYLNVCMDRFSVRLT